MTRLAPALTALALALPGGALADCATDADVAAFVADYLAKTPTRALVPGGSMEDALCTRAKVVAALSDHLGPVVGYKAGLTSKPAQEAFGVAEPVGGVLYRDMLLQDGATVPAAFGARPLFERRAERRHDTRGGDGPYRCGAPLHRTARPDLCRGRTAERHHHHRDGGGAPAWRAGRADPRHLGIGQVGQFDEGAHRSDMGHRRLGCRGVVQPGDLISVGSIGPLLPPAKAMGKATVTYSGLPGDPSVSVNFE